MIRNKKTTQFILKLQLFYQKLYNINIGNLYISVFYNYNKTFPSSQVELISIDPIVAIGILGFGTL